MLLLMAEAGTSRAGNAVCVPGTPVYTVLLVR